MNMDHVKEVKITSPDFENNGRMMKSNTGRGEDVSPELHIEGLTSDAVSIAVIMDDLNHPIKNYNHWVIWNISPISTISRSIPAGDFVSTEGLGMVVQGIGYGRHRYRGPKPPWFFKKPHKYLFKLYVLDCKLDIDANSKKKDLLQAMDGHVIQYGEITGVFGNDQVE